MYLPPLTPKSDWTMPNMAELPSWAEAKRVCIDLETRDPQLKKLGPGVRRDGFIIGIAFAIEDGPSFYLPIQHANGENLDRNKVLEYMRDQVGCFRGEIVGANLPYDIDYLSQVGVDFLEAPVTFRDVQIAEPLLDENKFSYSLDNIASSHGIPGKDESLLKQAAKAWGVHPKSGMWQIPAKFVGDYAAQDCLLPLQLLRRQERMIEAQGLQGLYDLESRLLPVLVKMRRRGVAIDFAKLDEVEEWALQQEVSALSRITHLTGIRLDTSDTTKTRSLIPVLRYIGIDIPLTEKGNPSVKNDWLNTLPKDDVIQAILDAKRFNKLRGTFVDSIRRHSVNGRIHCTFKQMVSDEGGARYGRMSCKDPNLQQQPARDPDIGPMWRSIYLPDEGGEWACLDYSQQEPRWMTHYAELMKLPMAKQAADKYRQDPTTDNHQMMADLASVPRKYAKNIFLGLCYGMGSAKLANELGFGTKQIRSTRSGRMIEVGDDECQKLLDLFHSRVPYLNGLKVACEDRAEKRGFITTAGGRRCRFPVVYEKGKRKYDWTHKALNRLIQGSAGDQTKAAMVAADEAGVRLQLQVHDELDFTIWKPEEALECAEVMRHALPCNIPAKVDIEVGPNWGEIKEPTWAR
jgi:DNA polymerase I-like protein with 3'-5' exonuclease and polymerase domains